MAEGDQILPGICEALEGVITLFESASTPATQVALSHAADALAEAIEIEDIQAEIAPYRGPEFSTLARDHFEPTVTETPYGIACLKHELAALQNATEHEYAEKLGDCSYSLARLVAGRQLPAQETKKAIRAIAQSSGIIACIGRARFRHLAAKNWRSGLTSPRTPRTNLR